MDLYSEQILEHFRASPHKRILTTPSQRVVEFNPLCGDVVQLDITFHNGRIIDAGFMGTGCAISQAATSLLIEDLKGKTVEHAKKFTHKNMIDLLGVPISPAREKCAILGLTALTKAVTISNAQKHQNTKENDKEKRKKTTKSS